jgi:hypothetical protein
MPPKKSPGGTPKATRAAAPVVNKNKAKGAKTGKFTAVNQYLQTVTAWPAKAELLPYYHKVSEIAHTAAQAEAKTLSRGLEADYEQCRGVPTIRYGGRVVLHVALFKEHVCILGSNRLQAHPEVAPLLAKWSKKGLTHERACVRFTRKMLNDHGAPEDLVKAYGKLGVRDAQAALDAKKKPSKNPSTRAPKAGSKATKATASPSAGKKGAKKPAAKK